MGGGGVLEAGCPTLSTRGGLLVLLRRVQFHALGLERECAVLGCGKAPVLAFLK